jgi:phenylacetate-CoA ligase
MEALKDFVMNRKRISAFDMSEKSMEEYYETCKRFKPKFLYGYTSALYKFAQYLQDNNKVRHLLNLKVVISSSETLYGHQRRLLEEVFGCKVANEYGTAEVGIIAFECPHGGMHITSENVYVELLRNGQPVKEGQTGEVVVTGLRNYAMPLIRYKLGDLATRSAKSCPCGRGLPLLESIQGRDNDMVVTSNGNVLHSEIFAYINRDLIEEGFLVKEFKITQKARDKLKVLVLKGVKENVIEAMRRKIEERVGGNIKIDFEPVEKIPLEKSGKVRYFTSELNNT